jgi:hypothetical protein
LTLTLPAVPKQVRTASGLVSGLAGRNSAITVFKGIPFAAPIWPAVNSAPAETMEVGDRFQPIPIAVSPPRIAFFRRFLSAR